MGDGVLTPAISVVSAIEGLQLGIPSITRGSFWPTFDAAMPKTRLRRIARVAAWHTCHGTLQRLLIDCAGTIIGVAVAILAVLFLIQQFGTATVGYSFAPVVALFFIFNSVIGIYNIAKYSPSIFKVGTFAAMSSSSPLAPYLNVVVGATCWRITWLLCVLMPSCVIAKVLAPTYWFRYFLNNKGGAWRSLSGVLLSITGAEALFADLGHFNRQSIQLGMLCIVYPALLLTYLGQAAYLTQHPENVRPFAC